MSKKGNSTPSPASYQAPMTSSPIAAAAPTTDLSATIGSSAGGSGQTLANVIPQIAPPPPEIAKPVTASPTGQIANMPIPMANVEKTQPSKGDVNKPPNPYGGDFRMYDFKK